jgi:hypothetical protein
MSKKTNARYNVVGVWLAIFVEVPLEIGMVRTVLPNVKL